jgi:putative membrane-bound dehydrogenase-like protein
MPRSLVATLLVVAFATTTYAEDALNILFLGDNGHHQPALRARQLIPALARRGIEVTYTDGLDDLRAETLNKYDGLVIYANQEKISPEQEAALLEYVAAGHGLIPLHCASYCFLNSDKYIALVGAQFQKHGTGTFRVENVQPDHPIMRGFGGFESWDETYIHHKHNDKDRTVLEVRAEGDAKEPWTWVRKAGKGRVFYTAWGHDERTWGHPGFINLVERGIRWACGDDELKDVSAYRERESFAVPKMTPQRKDVKPFEYVDVGPKIPNYTRGGQWGAQGKPRTEMQKPLAAAESLKHFSVPEGFRVELFASEPDFAGKPIAMSWDERGRLWVCETVDYPNELQPPGKGRDRIRICEDTDGDWKADKFTVFAEGLSIPTAVAFARGGAIVQDGTQTLFLKDTDGDDKADLRRVLMTGWGLGDTHGGVSNFRYGLDNWYWGMQGYNDSAPRYGIAKDGKLPQQSQPFRQGFFRFKLDQQDPPNVVELEFVRSTNNNTWGLGFSEEGVVFGSTANHNPSVYMPIANRYYERVRGWSPQQLGTIADSHLFKAITENVRQVDHHGGYTAGAGHALYTARRYPKTWWNCTAFVCEPTGHLVGTFVLTATGADFTSTSPCNLVASDDEWSSPIMAEVGPDGCVWILDWYNYIIQHNPTPQGFKTGRGNAYESELRDKKHGRVYRLVYGDEISPVKLTGSDAKSLVAALKSDNMLWRLHAQRLLVERGNADVTPDLLTLVRQQQPDEIGQSTSAIHALHVLDGLSILHSESESARVALLAGLQHSATGVVKNALAVAPRTEAALRAVLECGALTNETDGQLRLAALLALSDATPDKRAAQAIVALLQDPQLQRDRWLLDAATSAAATHDVFFLSALAEDKVELPSSSIARVALVAEHFARGKPDAANLAAVLQPLPNARPTVSEAIVFGLAKGWADGHAVKLPESSGESLAKLLVALPTGAKGQLLKLAPRWGAGSFEKHTAAIVESLAGVVENDELAAEKRAEAARQWLDFQPQSEAAVGLIVEQITPQSSAELAETLIQSLAASQAANLAEQLLARTAGWTPRVRAAAMRVLLARPESTNALLKSIEAGNTQFNDLTLDQKQSLASHPDKQIAALAKKLLASGGGLPSPDRVKVLEEFMPVAKTTGDPALGKDVFKKQCSKCHTHSGEGTRIGPDLTGMAVHPKEELLGHILDPSKSVEGNYRVYTVVTLDGLVLNGMLAGESKTTLEIVDTEAKRHTVLREDIEELVASTKSLMPEGFEKQLSKDDFTHLLEFLTQRGKYVPLDLAKVATINSTRGMFYDEAAAAERLIFSDWGPKDFEGVPFALVNPQGDRAANVVLLHGPQGKFPPTMPKSVSLACNLPAKAVHLLSGVSGWGYPAIQEKSVSMIVRLHYADGTTEDHELKNGLHFADYIRRVDVPDSKFAFALRGQQLRYLAVVPKRQEPLASIELVKGSDASAPIVVAVTVETPQP